MVVHLFLNNNKALDFLPINSIKNGGITVAAATAKAAMESGVATRPIEDLEAYAAKLSGMKL